MDNKWSDPTPIALFLGAAVLTSAWAFLTGLVTPGCTPIFGVYLVSAGVAWLVLGIISIRNGDLFGAILNFVLGAILGLGAGLEFLIQAWAAQAQLTLDPRISGFIMFGNAAILFVMAVAASRMFWHLVCGMLTLSVVFLLLGLTFIGVVGPTVPTVAGWLVLAVAVYFFFMGVSMTVNTAFQRPIFKLGRPLLK